MADFYYAANLKLLCILKDNKTAFRCLKIVQGLMTISHTKFVKVNNYINERNILKKIVYSYTYWWIIKYWDRYTKSFSNLKYYLTFISFDTWNQRSQRGLNLCIQRQNLLEALENFMLVRINNAYVLLDDDMYIFHNLVQQIKFYTNNWV